MIKRLFILMMLAVMAVIFLNLAGNYRENTELSRLGHYYAENGPQELGAPNLVTAVVVTYRGLDTLGEVTVPARRIVTRPTTAPIALATPACSGKSI